ncbi:hypothetical protein TNCT_323221 [Trichonephila clavata]|uniref:Maf-like protein n=1 Tax=Trichonephila clavata TaxID=2740835 RepID=A0A8X6KZQ9_TRICU|nr:hypothetical protein TNCT_323221 [Trichonephila clavata]
MEQYDWIRNPFATNAINSTEALPLQIREEFTDLNNDMTLKLYFSEVPLDVFWIYVKKEYPHISYKAILTLLPFSTTYLCEQSFSTLVLIKNDKRSCLKDLDQELRVALSNIEPNIKLLCSLKQAQLPKRLIVAADTVFILENEVLGRPESTNHNIEMLTKLSGKCHEVLTCVTLVYGMEKDANGEPVFLEKSFFDSTIVKITDIPRSVITEYVKTGEPEFKAGGYSITELGATLVERIYGDYYNIIGLPAYRTAKEIRALLDAQLI